MNCPDTASILYSPLANRVAALTWMVWALVIWNALLTGLALYAASCAKRKVDDTAREFAGALQRSLLGGKEVWKCQTEA